MHSWRRKGSRRRSRRAFEVVVLEGADVGAQFTVNAPVTEISRGRAVAGRTDKIRLEEPTVSVRQATLLLTPEGVVIEHRSEAKNPTQVNGRRIQRQKLEEGDQIRMGHAVLQLRSSDLVGLNGAVDAPAASRESDASERPVAAVTEVVEVSGTTEVHPTGGPYWCLRVAVADEEERRFPIRASRTTIGRKREDFQPDIAFPGRFKGISRPHARVEWDGKEIVIVHLSRTNSTVVNGVALTEAGEERVLDHGDEIRLPDEVKLFVERMQAEAAPALGRKLDDLHRMEQEIEEHFKRDGSFLDVDVAGSTAMKSESKHPHHVYLSFERWRSFVRKTVEEFDGVVLNSNGDELMCFFESGYSAVKSGSEVLKRLGSFNEEENLLASDFRLRIGIHSGRCLVDLATGKAFSSVLDMAGHLQKAAPVDGLLISDTVLRELPEGVPFEPGRDLEREGMPVYRLVGWVE